MSWLLLHLVATAVLAGVGWVVQVVVYPAFALVGAAEWPAYHRQHLRRIGWVVGPPWVVQGVSVGALLLASPWEHAALGALAAAGVGLTVLGAVPAHDRLDADRDLRRLLRANLLRTLAWTVATVVAAAQLAARLPFPP
ncbi:hypothetical protein GCM10017691_15980 [Pseudonocardia petroleophila]|uniref:hypothetical protein n=1 Tax=Pseudonocardia petroleophila TaxID=37331 RepID=UPI002102E1ED|nr:hypothetical protein [Pseudonocardia petroleophila]